MVKKKRTNLKIFIITMIITITILLILLKIAYSKVADIISYAAVGIFLLMPVIIVSASILNYYKLKKIHKNDDESVKDRLGQNRNKWFAVAGIWVALIIVAGGYTVVLKLTNHPDISVSYCHVSPIFLVKRNQEVKRGELIAKVGPKYVYGINNNPYKDANGKPTNGATTGCHLHLTIKENGVAVNPLKYYTK